MIEIRFEGGKEMARNLELLSQRVSRRLLREALTEAGEPMRTRMSQLAPHEPGKPDLRDNIAIGPARGIDEREVAVAVGPIAKFYAASFQELGTYRHGPQPFARPAFDETWMTTLRIFAAAMWREIARRGGAWFATAPTDVIPGPPMGGRMTGRGFEGRTL